MDGAAGARGPAASPTSDAGPRQRVLSPSNFVDADFEAKNRGSRSTSSMEDARLLGVSRGQPLLSPSDWSGPKGSRTPHPRILIWDFSCRIEMISRDLVVCQAPAAGFCGSGRSGGPARRRRGGPERDGVRSARPAAVAVTVAGDVGRGLGRPAGRTPAERRHEAPAGGRHGGGWWVGSSPIRRPGRAGCELALGDDEIRSNFC